MSQAIKFAVAAAIISASPQIAHAQAKSKESAPQLVTCEESIGSIALVDGDQARWAKWGLGSPRALINALARESGCFTIDDPNDAVPARFLVTAIAGSEEEVDREMEIAKGAAMEGLVRSGAAGSLLGGVPMGGAVMGMFGGLGGKKQTVAAGLRVVSPGTGCGGRQTGGDGCRYNHAQHRFTQGFFSTVTAQGNRNCPDRQARRALP
jgi:hypothetical protein